MKIAIGSDHAAYELKEQLRDHIVSLGHETFDAGCATSSVSVDYPDVCSAVTSKIVEGDADLGVLVCGTGIGMTIAANKTEGIYAALCTNEYMARMSRRHNDANVLTLGARVIGLDLAKEIVTAWLSESAEQGRHEARRAKVRAIESRSRRE